MTAAACVVLAVVHLLVWVERRHRTADLALAMLALGIAALAAGEMAIAHSHTIDQYIIRGRWLHVPAFVVIVSMVWFTRAYLGTGRRWLAWGVCVIRAISLLLNFLMPLNL